MSDEPTTETATPEAAEPQAPLLRVVNPDATPEEVAALVAVFSALGSGGAPAPRKKRVWGSPERLVRPQVRPGLGSWRGSGLPH